MQCLRGLLKKHQKRIVFFVCVVRQTFNFGLKLVGSISEMRSTLQYYERYGWSFLKYFEPEERHSVELFCAASCFHKDCFFDVQLLDDVTLRLNANMFGLLERQATVFRESPARCRRGRLYKLYDGDFFPRYISHDIMQAIAEYDWNQLAIQATIWEQENLDLRRELFVAPRLVTRDEYEQDQHRYRADNEAVYH